MEFERQILKPLHASLECKQRDAFCINGMFYTYGQFANRISAIRDTVRSLCLEEQVCALAIHDDLDTYASIMALWLEGKAYVPLHPHQPLTRNQNIIAQVGLTNVLDSAEQSPFASKNIDVIKTSDCVYTSNCLDSWKAIDDDALAYILFTSGSTGVPKGVRITRGNIAAFVDSFWKTGIAITPADRCMQLFDLTFDVSVQSYLLPLLHGACVFTVPYGQVKYLYAASLIQEQRVTFGAMAPSMLTYLRPYFSELDASGLKTCILTAEACPIDLLDEWSRCASNADIYDFYGPTEATIYCTCYKYVRRGDNLSSNGIVSIGKPLANVDVIILDESGNEISTSEKGELCVSGSQVTPGYWNNEEKNYASFFAKATSGEEKRYYHTGDLCYFDLSGNIMYSGRIDHQAKIQGFRVELSEIEYHARGFFQGKNRVVALAFSNRQGLTEIALFVESDEAELSECLDYLRERMPYYMIPSRIIYKTAFPMNSSDKVDRNKLMEELINYE